MSMLFAIALAWTAGAVDVQVAPDQPIPCVYIDDPLIIEFRAAEDVEAAVTLEATREQDPPTTIDLGAMRLRGHGALWRDVRELKPQRGRYALKFTITAGGETMTREARFAWIDRPFSDEAPPITLGAGGLDAKGLLAAQVVPLHAVRLDAANGDVERQSAAASAAGLKVTVALAAQSMPNPLTNAQDLVARLNGAASSWEIDPTGATERIAPVAEGLRKANARPAITLIAENAATIEALLTAAGQYDVRGAMLRQAAPGPAEIRAFRDAVERTGYEGMKISTRIAPPSGDPAAIGPALMRELLTCRAEGAANVEIADYPLYVEAAEPGQAQGIAPGFAHLSALVHRLRDATAVGELSMGAGVHAPAFRQGAGWILAVWSDDAPKDVTIPVGKAIDLKLTDALNNPADLPAPADDGVKLRATPSPVYLSGREGAVLSSAATVRARAEAQAFVNASAFRETIPSEILPIIQGLATKSDARLDRREFFALMGMFAYVEQRWHAGRLSRGTAAPTIGALTRLCRALCVLEEDSEEPFVEPLQDTVSRASKSQSQYVTGTGSDENSGRRGDWISGVVSDLLAEAERLNDVGRNKEAKAVAALAEWRARALEAAASAAPLSAPEAPLVEDKSVAQKPAVQKAVEEKPTEEKKTNAKSSASSTTKSVTKKSSGTRSRRSR